MLSKPTTIFNCLKGILVAQQVRFVLLTLVVLLSVNGVRHNAGVAHAGAIARSCKDLIVFAGANVNNYVKQFAGVTDPDLPLGQAGKMMALLIQLDGLYSQIGYGPLGYVYIKTADGNPEECLNELIIKRLLGEECCSSSLLGKGRSAILLSGHFQRVKDQIYLLTSVEFFRNGIDEIVSIPSREGGDGKISFVANLPDTAVSFAPRKFTKKQLDRVAHYYSDVMDVREEPDVNLKAKKIDPFAIDGFSYYIEEKRSDDWLKIKSFKHGLPSGWVRVPDDIGGRGLRDLLPELYFMEATALYLQTRIRRNNSDFSSERYKRHLLKFKSLEGEFAKRIQGAGDRRALGILKSMHAVLMLERKGADINAEEMMRISELSAEAAELLPTSSEAQSLADLTRFTAEHLRDGESFSINATELEKNLLQVLSTDPANIHVKTSLEMLWRLRLSYGDNNWQTKKLNVLRDRFRADENVQRVINSLTAPSDLRIHSPD